MSFQVNKYHFVPVNFNNLPDFVESLRFPGNRLDRARSKPREACANAHTVFGFHLDACAGIGAYGRRAPERPHATRLWRISVAEFEVEGYNFKTSA
jgi:hypothetical protein